MALHRNIQEALTVAGVVLAEWMPRLLFAECMLESKKDHGRPADKPKLLD